MPAARSEHMKAAALPTSSMVTLRRSGAAASKVLSILRKLPTPDAARVLIGRAELALPRVPSGPGLSARYRPVAARLALATPNTLSFCSARLCTGRGCWRGEALLIEEIVWGA